MTIQADAKARPTGKTAAITIEGVSFAYEAAPVLTNVNLTIDEGDFVSIIGPNGGGKTTLLRLMLGLLTPRTGVIRVLGESPEHARSRVGYVPQYFQFDTSFPVTVMDVVLMGRLDRHRSFGHYRGRDRAAADKALRDVEVYDLRDHPFSELSGGQRQRVLIARALASEPRLFLLDEPTTNVDPAVQDELYDLLAVLNQRLTIVMVSHDIGLVSTLVKRVVCVNRTVWVHPTSDLTGETIASLYGSNVSMVRHDLRCAEKGHEWRSS
jgi:zinc transport system ATP-binding protein